MTERLPRCPECHRRLHPVGKPGGGRKWRCANPNCSVIALSNSAVAVATGAGAEGSQT